MRGPRRLRENAKASRRCETKEEKRLWRWLRTRRFLGFKFRRQHPVARYILDFYRPELRLAIEIDGRHHASFDMTMYDGERPEARRGVGIEVVRITNEELRRDALLVQVVIEHAIVTRSNR